MPLVLFPLIQERMHAHTTNTPHAFTPHRPTHTTSNPQNKASTKHVAPATGNTLLHLAAWHGSAATTEWLLEHSLGGSVHTENLFGSKPLDLAPPGECRQLLHRKMQEVPARKKAQ